MVFIYPAIQYNGRAKKNKELLSTEEARPLETDAKLRAIKQTHGSQLDFGCLRLRDSALGYALSLDSVLQADA